MSKIKVSDSNVNTNNKPKGLNRNLVLYELRNIAGNPFIHAFGICMPIFLSRVIASAASKEIPAEALAEGVTSISIGMSLLVPMAAILIGHTATYSQEMENGIPQRMTLFGFEERTIFMAKGIAELIYMTIALGIYAVMESLMLDIQAPAVTSAICLVICLYLISVIFYVLATGIVNIVRKFGPSFAISMTLYFLFMILCGMMGIKTNELPGGFKIISKLLPMRYINNDFGTFWQGGTYNFVPLIQSFLFLGAVSGIVFYLSVHKKRGIK